MNNNEVVQELNQEVTTTKETVKKPRFELVKGDMIFVMVAFAVSIFSSVFGIFSGYTFGYMLSVILMVPMFFCYLV